MRLPPPVETSCTRMPSHFHSARNAWASSDARSGGSSGCASIGGRNTGASAASGFAPLPSHQANSASYGGASPCHTSSISSGVIASACPAASSASAILASRADAPTRSDPVISFSTA